MDILHTLLTKLHLSHAAYSMERRLSRNRIILKPVNADKALSFLHNISPDKGSSCIVSRNPAPTDCDLEIIVPCYNVEKYVEECLDSILSQKTKYRYCVTIVNDGSTDRTGEILNRYESIENVRIIHQKNRGLSGARNTAIEQSHGRYLLFVDSDDILLPDAIESYMSLAEQTGADVVDSGHIRFADRTNRGWKARIVADIYDAIQRPQVLPRNLSSPRITGYPCGKVLLSELFHKVQFPSGYWFEDTLVWMILEPMCKRKVTSDKLSFRYRMNPNSISHTAVHHPKSLDSLYITLRLLEDRVSLGIGFDQYQYEQLLSQMRMNFFRVVNLNEQVKQAVFAVECDLIAHKFHGWNTDNPALKPIEEFLRNGEYTEFELWCKWH